MNITGRGYSKCKAPEAGVCLKCWRYSKQGDIARAEGVKGEWEEVVLERLQTPDQVKA